MGKDEIYATIGSIVIAFVVDSIIRDRIQNKKKFSGIGYALLNGVLGIGTIWVLAIYFDTKREIKKMPDDTKSNKKYREYAELELKDFITFSTVCFIIWIIILVIMASS